MINLKSKIDIKNLENLGNLEFDNLGNNLIFDVNNEVFSVSVILPLLLTLLFTSLLEAFTLENDNLILPFFSVTLYIALTSIML